MSDRNNAVPGLFTILNQVVDGLATRLQIASIELSVAKTTRQRQQFMLFLPPFRPLCARFYIGRTSCYFLGRSPHFSFPALHCRRLSAPVPLFFLGKARNLAANMPYAFEESRQILAPT